MDYENDKPLPPLPTPEEETVTGCTKAQEIEAEIQRCEKAIQ